MLPSTAMEELGCCDTLCHFDLAPLVICMYSCYSNRDYRGPLCGLQTYISSACMLFWKTTDIQLARWSMYRVDFVPARDLDLVMRVVYDLHYSLEKHVKITEMKAIRRKNDRTGRLSELTWDKVRTRSQCCSVGTHAKFIKSFT